MSTAVQRTWKRRHRGLFLSFVTPVQPAFLIFWQIFSHVLSVYVQHVACSSKWVHARGTACIFHIDWRLLSLEYIKVLCVCNRCCSGNLPVDYAYLSPFADPRWCIYAPWRFMACACWPCRCVVVTLMLCSCTHHEIKRRKVLYRGDHSNMGVVCLICSVFTWHLQTYQKARAAYFQT